MERWELENTHAYRVYHGANRSRGTETEEQRDERLVTADIDALQAIRIEDTPEEAEQLEKASQIKLYEYLTQLNPKGNIEGNKRRLGSWCKNPTRTEALALTKLSIMNEYCDCFTPRYKETLSERIRKPEQVEHEKMIAPTLREMNAKMGKLFMKNFQLRQASKQLSN